MTHGIEEAMIELERSPQEPVLAEIGGLIVELRLRGRSTVDPPIGETEGAAAGNGLSYDQAMRAHLSRRPVFLKASEKRYPRREALHDRSGLR